MRLGRPGYSRHELTHPPRRIGRLRTSRTEGSGSPSVDSGSFTGTANRAARTAGPANASRFVRSLAVAAAQRDEGAIRALLAKTAT